MTTTDGIAAAAPGGSFFEDNGTEWYRIDEFDRLDPFLVTVVSSTDLWMFVSSSGALTAGRRNAGEALFPYETDDRLHRSGGRSGPLTIIRVPSTGAVWMPFSAHVPLGAVRRSVAKTAAGDRLRFEEYHPDLGATFGYTWSTADRFGVVRECELTLDPGRDPITVEILDGLLDVLPAGVDLSVQSTTSTLLDAYRRCEWDPSSGLAFFTLEALLSDRAEPAESLRANVVWSRGLPDAVVTLSDRAVRPFLSGGDVEACPVVKGEKGAFLVSAAVDLEPGTPQSWLMVADVEQDHRKVATLRSWLVGSADPRAEVARAVAAGSEDLIAAVAGADAIQETADRPAVVHHFANVLFNVMRGGIFLDGHRVDIADVVDFVAGRDASLVGSFDETVATLAPAVSIVELRAAVAADPHLSRLVAEYLPLSFSRRHGDPSRPWNTFHISFHDDSGNLTTGYQGNWRDIFQNWDALLHSYPEYFYSVVAKFLNASTVDGHNPYRISEDGIDWELPEEGAWANFGYWGDHQITYLHRLLDGMRRFHPGVLEASLGRVCFSYADVPYRILPYEDLVADTKNTIVFDDERQSAVDDRVAAIGADGRLVPGSDGVHLASLAEKLLVPAFAKLSNLVVGGGVWMNTQRPEWNDANNALVGNGVSMVTLWHLRSYLSLLGEIIEGSQTPDVVMGSRVLDWMRGLERVFADHRGLLSSAEVSAAERRSLLDGVGQVFSDYRDAAYCDGPGEPVAVALAEIGAFVETVRAFVDHTAAMARRSDGLFESYCLVHLVPGEARLEPLYEMLEGQVAALSASEISVSETVSLVDEMYASALYRSDQKSFLLYPYRDLPSFMDKNVVEESSIGPVARALLDRGDSILRRDAEGRIRFDSRLHSARDLEAMFDEAADQLDAAGRAELLDLYEGVFRHAAFTGRSGTMYGYEGLGSVYWHMVSKLLFALQDRLAKAVESGESKADIDALATRYHRVRDGLGFRKSVVEQGTFPTDPHSHTPAHTGAQQPGMTGQVKEGVLIRWGELGVHVDGGRARFIPILLSPGEFLEQRRAWPALGDGAYLEPGSLGFTYCSVPVVYHLVDDVAWSRTTWADGRVTEAGDRLDREASRALFARNAEIARIDVGVPRGTLVQASDSG